MKKDIYKIIQNYENFNFKVFYYNTDLKRSWYETSEMDSEMIDFMILNNPSYEGFQTVWGE